MSDAKVVFLPSMSLIYEDNVLESVDISGETFYRKQRDWQAVARAHELTIERMGDENARLKELVRDMWGWLLTPTVGGATLHDLQGRMRELGVEVDK